MRHIADESLDAEERTRSRSSEAEHTVDSPDATSNVALLQRLAGNQATAALLRYRRPGTASENHATAAEDAPTLLPLDRAPVQGETLSRVGEDEGPGTPGPASDATVEEAPDAGGVDTGSATADAAKVEIAHATVAPEAQRGTTPAHPGPARPGFDLAGGQQILTATFGTIKTIVPGSIQLLEQDAFQVAYDKIYGKGQYSWEKYVKVKYGNLNGFAHEGVNYINKAIAGLHTIVHEMLHNNCASDFIGVVGSRWNEGTTEILTQIACALFNEPAPVTYPGESPVVQAALDAGLPFSNLEEAYLTGGAASKIADWVTANCVSSWNEVMEAMEANLWAAAKAGLTPKAPDGGVCE